MDACIRTICQREGIEHAQPLCQQIPGRDIDEAISQLLVEAVSPVALEVALTVHQELQSRLEDADRLLLKQVERAQYEADLARRRYMRVDPDNRLVADSLEAEWNGKLRTLTETQQERERQREQDRQVPFSRTFGPRFGGARSRPLRARRNRGHERDGEPDA